MNFDSMKQHFKKNKNVYLVGTGCLVVGVIGGVAYSTKSVQIVDAMNLKINSPTTSTVITVLERRACMEPIPIRCKETGEVFGSIRRAAQVTGVNRKDLADNLIGLKDSVKGFSFEKIALAE